MKTVWIYLVITILTHKEGFSAELQFSKTTDNGILNSNSNILRLSERTEQQKNYYSVIIEETLTSCPESFGIEGIYEITVPGLDPFPVLCNAQIAGAGYAVIASRSNVKLNFFRDWQEYKNGFGHLSGDFFIGLDKLHAITKSQAHELYIHMEDFEGNTRFARYNEFYIENENALYKMSKLGTYTGDAGDSLSWHNNQNFSTYDKDNDPNPNSNCARIRMGGWWYNNCIHSNLFGTYYGGAFSSDFNPGGVSWYHWRGHYYSLKTIKMMVRPKCICL